MNGVIRYYYPVTLSIIAIMGWNNRVGLETHEDSRKIYDIHGTIREINLNKSY